MSRSDCCRHGRLETDVGDRLRWKFPVSELDAKTLMEWRQGEDNVHADLKACRPWLDKDWTKTNELHSLFLIERAIGDKL